MVGFGTGFTGRAGMGKKPLTLADMRTHIVQVKALLHGDIAEIDGGLAQILASDGWLPDRPIEVPVYMAGQGPKARALAKEITDGPISVAPADGFETCLVSTNGTVLDNGEDITSPRVSTAVKPLVALAYHLRYTTDPESVKALPNGEAWLASVERADKSVRHLSVHRGHNHRRAWWDAERHRLAGTMLLAENKPDEGEASLQQAIRIAQAQQAKSLELRAVRELARLWGEQARRTKARDLLASVYSWFTEGFDTADLKEAKALLDQLARAAASLLRAMRMTAPDSTIRWLGYRGWFRVELAPPLGTS